MIEIDNKRSTLCRLVAVATLFPALNSVLPAAHAEQLQLEEVIVTARKRSESLQRTPIAVSALTSQDLQEIGLEELTSIATSIPNLQIQRDASGSSAMSICMRGLCRTDTIITEDQMAAVYIDGFANAKAFGTFFELLDIERIEVLRGPQGTLYGKNSLAGAINVVTKTPSDTFEGRVVLGIGSENLFTGNMAVNLPVSDAFALKLAYSKTERDGLVQNTIGPDLNDRNNQAARIAVRWNPVQELTVDYTLDWYQARQIRYPSQLTYVDPGLETLFPGITQTASVNRQNTRAAISPDDEVDQTLHGVTIMWDIGPVGGLDDVTVKSLTGIKDTENNTFGSSSSYYFLANDARVTVDVFTQELQFLASALNDKLQIVSGVYFARTEGDFTNFFHFGTEAPSRIDVLATDDQSWAIFTEASFDFTERLTASLGVRYTDEVRKVDLNRLSPEGTLLSPISALAEADKIETDNVSPRVSLQYQLNDNVMTYATYARGFKSGGLNGRAGSPADFAEYEDTVLDSIEVGIKADVWNDRIRLNAALFYQSVDDLQIQVNSLDPATFQFLSQIRNAGEATITGAELETTVLLAESLSVSANIGWIDPEYKEFLAFDAATGQTVDARDDREFQFAPEITYSLTLRYEQPIADLLTLVGRLEYAYVDEQDFTVVREPRIIGNDYALLNARLAFNGIVGSQFTVAFWGKNLTDEEYRIGGFAVPTFGIAPPDGLGRNLYGDTRTYGMEVSYQW